MFPPIDGRRRGLSTPYPRGQIGESAGRQAKLTTRRTQLSSPAGRLENVFRLLNRRREYVPRVQCTLWRSRGYRYCLGGDKRGGRLTECDANTVLL